MSKPLVLISPWFGPWPAWIDFFLESCRKNPDVAWIILTDQPPPENRPDNVRFDDTSFDAFRSFLEERLDLRLDSATPYKICDFRPALGFVYEEAIADFRAFGYCDLDVIFGDLRAVYTDDILERYDAISACATRMSGHLAVFRNSEKNRNLFRRIAGWRELLADERHRAVDEHHLTRLIRPRNPLRWLARPRSLFVERHTTPGGPLLWPDGKLGPSLWVWKDGTLSNERFGSQLYLHMMFWQSNRWLPEAMQPAPWTELEEIVQCDWREAAEKGFTISPRGIRLLRS